MKSRFAVLVLAMLFVVTSFSVGCQDSTDYSSSENHENETSIVEEDVPLSSTIVLQASKMNSVTVPLEEGDSLDAVGVYRGSVQIPASIDIGDAEVEILTDDELSLDTVYTIKVYTSNGNRYELIGKTPEYMDFEVATWNTTPYSPGSDNNTDSENGFLIKIPANPDKGFNYPYYIKVPLLTVINGEAPYELLAETNNNGSTKISKEYFDERTKWSLEGNAVQHLAGKINGIAVMTTFPRPMQAWEYYTHTLDRDSFFVTEDVIERANVGDFTRLDLQFKAILEDAIEQCNANGFTINGKPMLHGFSASSGFANRYAMIHPETIKALAVQHHTMMPLSAHNGNELPFPMGVADFEKVTGVYFNESAYKALPQFWLRGSRDYNDPTQYYDGWDTMGATYRKIFGEDITERKDSQVSILQDAGFSNIKFKEYQDVGHHYTNEIFNDCIEFYNSVK